MSERKIRKTHSSRPLQTRKGRVRIHRGPGDEDLQARARLNRLQDLPAGKSTRQLRQDTVQRMQQRYGNTYVRQLLLQMKSEKAMARTPSVPVASQNAPAAIQRGILGSIWGGIKKIGSSIIEGIKSLFGVGAKGAKKKMIEKAKAVGILQDAYGSYKKMTAGTVEVLGQADFEKAYEKIYGETEWAWDKYVVPKHGNLEGFAYEGTNYINKDIGSVDVVPHEMLHNNADPKWRPFSGSETDEGATEYLTIKATKAAKYTPSHSYPDQEAVIQKLVGVVGEDKLMKAYFNGDTGPLKKAVDDKCAGTWSDFKKAMDEAKWTRAKALLENKKKK